MYATNPALTHWAMGLLPLRGIWRLPKFEPSAYTLRYWTVATLRTWRLPNLSALHEFDLPIPTSCMGAHRNGVPKAPKGRESASPVRERWVSARKARSPEGAAVPSPRERCVEVDILHFQIYWNLPESVAAARLGSCTQRTQRLRTGLWDCRFAAFWRLPNLTALHEFDLSIPTSFMGAHRNGVPKAPKGASPRNGVPKPRRGASPLAQCVSAG
jgi:hypothetical protein